MNTNWLLITGTVLLVMAVIPATGIVMQWRRVNWQSSEMGRVLHNKSLAIAVVLWLSLVGASLLIFGVGRPLWFELLRWIAFGYVDVMLWRQFLTYRDTINQARIDAEGA